MESIKVLYISQEITPYLPDSQMSTIARNLPQGVQEKGREIRTFMPRFGCINERRNQLHEVIRLSGMNLIIDDSDHPLIIKVASIQSARMQVYFIDNEDFFQRKCVMEDDNGLFFPDNDERAIFFARGVIETVKKLRWAPDVIHCHGWFTSFVPLFIKRYYSDDPMFAESRVITSIYDDGFDHTFDKKITAKAKIGNIADDDFALLDPPNYSNLLKMASSFSDGIIFGSQNVHPEVRSYIESSGVPVLQYPGEEYLEAYNNFYDEILSVEINNEGN
ncbi:MAG: glycogen/starch synthase [Bacteroidales bacterium]|nr:glycogen/starch synthase [Bacteroidales bacterium]